MDNTTLDGSDEFRIRLGDWVYQILLMHLSQFGMQMRDFLNSQGLVIAATHVPNLSHINDISDMFPNADIQEENDE